MKTDLYIWTLISFFALLTAFAIGRWEGIAEEANRWEKETGLYLVLNEIRGDPWKGEGQWNVAREETETAGAWARSDRDFRQEP